MPLLALRLPYSLRKVSFQHNTNGVRKQCRGIILTRHVGDGEITFPKLDTSTISAYEMLASVSNSNQASISASGFAARKYLRISATVEASTSMTITMRFNNDSGSTYSWRSVLNESAGSSNQDSSITLAASTSSPNRIFDGIILNIQNKVKVFRGVSATVGSSLPSGMGIWDNAGAWANTSNQITRIDIIASTGNLGAAQLTVEGRD